MGSGPISGENSTVQYCETRFNEMLRGLQEADGNIVPRDLAIALSVIHCRYARRGPTPKLPYYAYRADAASTGTIRHCIDRLQTLADEIHAQKRLSPTALSIGAKYALNDIEKSLPGGKLIGELVHKDHPWLAGLKLHDRFILTRGRVIIA